MEQTKPMDLNKIDWSRYELIPVTENGEQIARIIPKFKKPLVEPIFPYPTD